MSKSNEVDQFFKSLAHPFKAEMERTREIIMAASPLLTETVKWGGPSFEYGETLATFSPRVKDCVALVFHDGAPFLDRFPFLEPAPKGKAYAKFRSMEDVEKHRAELGRLVTTLRGGQELCVNDPQHDIPWPIADGRVLARDKLKRTVRSPHMSWLAGRGWLHINSTNLCALSQARGSVDRR